ncbi:MAG: hypothetical protein PHC51_04820 [bacterium]|nr:hypothetical protein [bacterium]
MDVLSDMHRRLCVCFEVVEEVLITVEVAHGRLTLAVLLDDLDALIEESEQLLITGGEVEQDIFSSFVARSATVIDEVRDYFRH